MENSLSLIAENNPKAKGRKAEEFIDPSFMDELESTGFIKSVWPWKDFDFDFRFTE